MKLLIILFSMMFAGSAFAGTSCFCQDADRDGRFGLVRVSANGKRTLIAGNFTRDINICNRLARKHNSCMPNSVNYCRCGDNDRDGRFGFARHSNQGWTKRN